MNGARGAHSWIVASLFAACAPQATHPRATGDAPSQPVRARRAEAEASRDACAYGAHPQAPPETPRCGAAGVCDDDADCTAHPHTFCNASACALAGCLLGQCTLAKAAGERGTRDAECAPAPCVVSSNPSARVCGATPGGSR